MKTILSLCICIAGFTSYARDNAFTYQGQLTDGGGPANGLYDFEFLLFDSQTPTNEVSPPILKTAVEVTNGLFTCAIDFGSVFDGSALWMQVSVRTNGTIPFTALSPLHELTPTPYAITASNALNAYTITGTVPDSGLSGVYTMPVLMANSSNSFAGTFYGDGSSLTELNASALVSGTISNISLTNIPGIETSKAIIGTNGQIIFQGTNGGSFALYNGPWNNVYGLPAAVIQPVATNQTGAFDVLSSSASQGTWIDIGTAVSGSPVNGTYLHMELTSTNEFGYIGTKGLGNYPGVPFIIQPPIDTVVMQVGVMTTNPIYPFQVKTGNVDFSLDENTNGMLDLLSTDDYGDLLPMLISTPFLQTHPDADVNVSIDAEYGSARLAVFNDAETANIPMILQAYRWTFDNSGADVAVISGSGDLWIKGSLNVAGSPVITNIANQDSRVFYSGSTNVGGLTTSVTISIGHAMPSTNYTPSVSFIGAPAVLTYFSQPTTTNFTLNAPYGIPQNATIAWSAIYSP